MTKTFEYSSYPLLISFTLVYLFGIYGFENKNLFWIAESLLFGLPGFYLLWKAQEITNKEGGKKSLLSKPLYIIGALMVIATLISFIVGFNDFLYSENQTIGWLLEAIAYLISAAASLYSADRLKKVN